MRLRRARAEGMRQETEENIGDGIDAMKGGNHRRVAMARGRAWTGTRAGEG